MSASSPNAFASAGAVIDKWSAAYSANDRNAPVKLYAPDAILLGTRSPIMSVGTKTLLTYFNRLSGSGRKNRIVEKRMIVLADNAVVGLGFYEFSGMQDGRVRPWRFAMLVIKRNGQRMIAHNHSSPRVMRRKK
jgi:hypothetical protein